MHLLDERWPPRSVEGDARQWHEQIFGPELAVVRCGTVDGAIALIYANSYGNVPAIFTSSGEAARRFQRGVHVGMVGYNTHVLWAWCAVRILDTARLPSVPSS